MRTTMTTMLTLLLHAALIGAAGLGAITFLLVTPKATFLVFFGSMGLLTASVVEVLKRRRQVGRG